MRRFLASFVVLGLVVCSDSPVEAQEEGPQPVKIENAEWYEVVNVTFEPGTAQEARQIIEEHFWPAAERADVRRPVLLFHRTGPWDLTLVFPMDGPAEYEWLLTEDGAKHAAALAEMAGGTEQAQQIWERYYSLVDRAESSLAYRPQMLVRGESGGN